MALDSLILVPWLPLLGAVLCVICCMRPTWRWVAGPVCVGSIALSFVITLAAYLGWNGDAATLTAFNWIRVGGFEASFAYLIDSLTFIMLFVVTGIGALIALYATGYMKGERGYARFFFGVALFIFAMATLVMADNLVLLYLGWEGVGLCSYLLIGYYYERDEAVQAAKKAFIVNRIGDLGFALGIFLTYWTFGTVEISAIVEAARGILESGSGVETAHLWIPFLLMLGALGKSAQIPLHMWLPDAMAGPTPVSALVHAATMVTAGVYLIARLIPVFQLSPYALPTVAAIGGITALFAATIALCQYDLKKVFAYSTVSQLGYMFLGVGALSTAGGIFHLFTHAFFKALLFLTAGSVMHALAGQLDLRKISGLGRKMPVTAMLMLVGCLALAGAPPFAGFFSKDAILAEAMIRGLDGQTLYLVLAVIGLLTALLTAFYTFRLWFRVFLGPTEFEMGDEHHAEDAEQRVEAEHHTAHEPHEMPWWPMNAPLLVLALGSILAGFVGFGHHHGWIGDMIHHSTADVPPAETAHGNIHWIMMIVSTIVALLGIGLAAYFHWLHRPAADRIAQSVPGLIRFLHEGYLIDTLADRLIVRPLRLVGYLGFVVDQMIIHGLVVTFAWLPRLVGFSIRPSQSGRLQGYGLGMVAGVGLILVLMIFVVTGA